MTESYSIEIPDDKAATHKVVTFIIALINLLAFGYASIYTEQGSFKTVVYIGLVVSLAAFFMFISNKYLPRLKSFRVEIAFIICACVWLILANYLPAALLLLFALAGLITNKKPVIHFGIEGIRYPSFPEKTFAWRDVDFVILKDDILSIEMKDNRLMQFTLDNKIAESVNTDQFNAFCKAAINNEHGAEHPLNLKN